MDEMDNIRMRLRQAMGEMRAAVLARKTGTSESMISRYFRDVDPSLRFITAVCVALNLSADWLLLGRGPRQSGEIDLAEVPLDQLFAEQSRRLVSMEGEIAALSRRWRPEPAKPAPDEADAASGFVEVAREAMPTDADWTRRYVPIISAVAAGRGIGTDQADSYPPGAAESYVEYAEAPRGAFACRVDGRSMEPRFADGDVVVIDPAATARAGRPAVVVYAGPGGVPMGVLKLYRRRGGRVRLESLAAGYPAIDLPATGVANAWPVLAHLRKGR